MGGATGSSWSWMISLILKPMMTWRSPILNPHVIGPQPSKHRFSIGCLCPHIKLHPIWGKLFDFEPCKFLLQVGCDMFP